MYRKLKRSYSSLDYSHIPNFKKVFPELNNLSREELHKRLSELNMDFYYEKKIPVPKLMRLSMPFAFIFIIMIIIFSPINYILTGNWGYSLSENNRILNWFRAVRIIR